MKRSRTFDQRSEITLHPQSVATALRAVHLNRRGSIVDNVLIHGYDVVQREVLWDTVQRSVPTLLNQIERILRDLEKR